MADTPTVADKIRARDIKQKLYDRDPSLCRQPFDDWLNALLQTAAARWGDDESTILLQAITGCDSSIAVASAILDEASDETVRAAQRRTLDDQRTLREALNAMRADLRSAPAADAAAPR